jgi:L-threonylcarbamoyladenylate synthase
MKEKIIIFPTDTVYGIGTSIYNGKSLKKIYKIKKRNLNKPISVLFYSLDQIKKIVVLDYKVKKIASFFWPGAITLIVPLTSFYSFLSKGEKKIGIRIPNHKLALKILKKEGPLSTTSVNQSGKYALNEYEEIKKKYQNQVDFIYQDNKENSYSSGIASTVIDTTIKGWKIIREGNITKKKLKYFLFKYFPNEKHF